MDSRSHRKIFIEGWKSVIQSSSLAVIVKYIRSDEHIMKYSNQCNPIWRRLGFL